MGDSKFFNKGISTPLGILIVVLCSLIAGGILAWQYWWVPKEEVKMPEEVIEDETADWETYSNSVYSVTFEYPASWQPKHGYQNKYEGDDGFFQISAISGKGLTIDEVYKLEAYHKLKPYGSQPKIETLQIQGEEARLILPSNDQPGAMKGQASLIIQYPQLIQISETKYYYFVLWADQNHIREIAKTFRFIEVEDETTNWKTYRNEEYGYEIKYPANWEINEERNSTWSEMAINPYYLLLTIKD